MRGNYLDTLTQRKTSLPLDPLDGNTTGLSDIDPRIELHRTQPNRTRTVYLFFPKQTIFIARVIIPTLLSFFLSLVEIRWYVLFLKGKDPEFFVTFSYM